MLNPVTLHTNDGRLSNAWKGLIRRLQTTVEATRLLNATLVDAIRGDVVFLSTSGPRSFGYADAATAGSSQGIGAVLHPIAQGTSGIVRTDNVALVRFIDAISPSAGDPVYVSATLGRATNAAGGLTNIFRIGTVFDASPYVTVTNPFAYVLLDRCCDPTQVP